MRNLSYQNEFCMQFHFMQIKVIFLRMVSHLDSLRNRGTRDLGNGILAKKRFLDIFRRSRGFFQRNRSLFIAPTTSLNPLSFFHPLGVILIICIYLIQKVFMNVNSILEPDLKNDLETTQTSFLFSVYFHNERMRTRLIFFIL